MAYPLKHARALEAELWAISLTQSVKSIITTFYRPANARIYEPQTGALARTNRNDTGRYRVLGGCPGNNEWGTVKGLVTNDEPRMGVARAPV